MMLSVAAPALSYNWQTLETGAEVAQQISFLPQQGTIETLAPIEGGFILSGHGVSGNGEPTIVATAGYNPNLTIVDLITQGTSLSTNSTTGEWSRYDLFGTGGFTARFISPSNIAPDWLSTTHPGPNGNAGDFAPQEGGLISIKSIPAPIDAGIEKKEAESALTTLPTKSLQRAEPGEHAESLQAKSSVREISGEWARAAVFEIAGGEPVADSRQTNIPLGKPLPAASAAAVEPSTLVDVTSNSARRAAGIVAAETSAQPVFAHAQNIAPNQTTIGQPLPSVTAGDDITQSRFDIRLNERASHDGAIARPPDEQPDEAVAAAFDQIGDGELALPSPSTDRPLLHNWLSGTPLLLMFALERVTARNPRRRRTTARADGA